MDMMTTRFGKIAIDAEDILLFPHGLVGYEDCQHWVLLADAVNPAVGWLQSLRTAAWRWPSSAPGGLCRNINCACAQRAGGAAARGDGPHLCVVAGEQARRRF